MIFGEKSRFAVDVELSQQSGGLWLFGTAGYWCESTRVGDHTLVTSLRDALFQFDEILKYAENRRSGRFDELAADEAFLVLDDGMFGSRRLIPDSVPEDEMWLRHWFMPFIDVFDDWKVFLVETNDVGRMLFRQRTDSSTRVVELDVGEADAVVRAAADYFEELYSHERERTGGGV